jgi:hypothetical protein
MFKSLDHSCVWPTHRLFSHLVSLPKDIPLETPSHNAQLIKSIECEPPAILSAALNYPACVFAKQTVQRESLYIMSEAFLWAFS